MFGVLLFVCYVWCVWVWMFCDGVSLVAVGFLCGILFVMFVGLFEWLWCCLIAYGWVYLIRLIRWFRFALLWSHLVSWRLIFVCI